MCVSSFSTTFVWNMFHSKKKWARYDRKFILVFMQSTLYSCPNLMKLQISRQSFEKYSNIKFHENLSIGSRVVPCVQTDGRTDRQKDEPNSPLSAILRTRLKKPQKCLYTSILAVLYQHMSDSRTSDNCVTSAEARYFTCSQPCGMSTFAQDTCSYFRTSQRTIEGYIVGLTVCTTHQILFSWTSLEERYSQGI
jgi:hypothetical protein